MPTTLAQMGDVAKVQVRATSHVQSGTPFADRLDDKGQLQAHRVQESEKAQAQKQVDPEQENLDKRQRRRQRRQERLDGHVDMEDDGDEGEADATQDASPLGHLVDLRA
jgi:hypothetical protein